MINIISVTDSVDDNNGRAIVIDTQLNIFHNLNNGLIPIYDTVYSYNDELYPDTANKLSCIGCQIVRNLKMIHGIFRVIIIKDNRTTQYTIIVDKYNYFRWGEIFSGVLFAIKNYRPGIFAMMAQNKSLMYNNELIYKLAYYSTSSYRDISTMQFKEDWTIITPYHKLLKFNATTSDIRITDTNYYMMLSHPLLSKRKLCKLIKRLFVVNFSSSRVIDFIRINDINFKISFHRPNIVSDAIKDYILDCLNVSYNINTLLSFEDIDFERMHMFDSMQRSYFLSVQNVIDEANKSIYDQYWNDYL